MRLVLTYGLCTLLIIFGGIICYYKWRAGADLITLALILLSVGIVGQFILAIGENKS